MLISNSNVGSYDIILSTDALLVSDMISSRQNRCHQLHLTQLLNNVIFYAVKAISEKRFVSGAVNCVVQCCLLLEEIFLEETSSKRKTFNTCEVKIVVTGI